LSLSSEKLVSNFAFKFNQVPRYNKDIQRPFYMTAKDAIEYGIIDKVGRYKMNPVETIA
jgi:ATP-dependent protease ClpP protease subunit